jgi:hypothetical protein
VSGNKSILMIHSDDQAKMVAGHDFRPSYAGDAVIRMGDALRLMEFPALSTGSIQLHLSP